MSEALTELGSAAALLLAALFAWAGIAKALRPSATRAGFVRLGVPAAAAAARVAPLGELGLAVLLLTRPRAGAFAALAALAAFSLVLARAVARGTTRGCACFGPGGESARLSTALLRNGLLALAAPAAWAGEPGLASLPALAAVSAATVVGVVGLALWDLRARTGRLWDNRAALAPRIEIGEMR